MSIVKNLNKKFRIIFLLIVLLGLLLVDTSTFSKIIEDIPNPVEKELFQKGTISSITDNISFKPQYDIIGGYGWDTPEVIKNPVYMNDLKIAIDDEDNAHVIWSARKDEEWFLYHIIKFSANNSWSQIKQIGKSTSNFDGVLDVASDKLGRIHITWLDLYTIKYNVYDNGQWSTPYSIDVGSQPHIQINDNNKPKILYNKIVEYRNYFFCATKEYANVWTYQQIPIWSTYYYNIIANSFNFLLSKEQDLERLYFMNGMIIQTGTSRLRTYELHYNLMWKENLSVPFTWSGYNTEYDLPQTFHYVSEPILLSTDDDSIHFIHQIINSTEEFSLAYQKRDASGYWGNAITLTNKANLKCHMSGAVDSFNRIVLMWNNIEYISGDTFAGIYMKFFSQKTFEWTDDMLLNPDHGYSQYPNLALDSDGNIHMIWLDQKDENRTLFYRKGLVDSDEDGLMNYEERDIYFTDPYDDDTDDDQLVDGDEIINGLDPFVQDSDSDGMFDGYEVHNDLDPHIDDSTGDLDGDLLTNIEEYILGTYANDNDSDNDIINDYDEVHVYFTNPLKKDTDYDKLQDGYEITVTFSNPNSNDTDNDTMDDWYEDIWGISKGFVLDILTNDSMDDPDSDGLINMLECQYRTKPHIADTDNDGLNDSEEVLIYHTHPIDKDTDLDGIYDGPEVKGYYYPSNPYSDPLGFLYTNPLLKDSDADQVNDLTEIFNKMNPIDNDSDDDLMIDGYEYLYRINPGLNASDSSDALLDIDNDGLTNLEESYIWTHPNKTDTDSDKLTDLEELTLGSDPTKWDTDFDGLNDYNELINLGTNATNPDTDGDGLNDFLEVRVYYSNPLNIDSDKDTIIDGDEVFIYGTNPMNKDSDNDLLEDNIELIFGSDPTLEDTDSDTMDDYFEFIYGLNPQIDDSQIDIEGDGIVNGDEHKYNSNPLLPDSDFDGLSDYEEIVIYFTRPDQIDTDLDSINDFDEIMIYFTSPHDPDTDDDRLPDGVELLLGTDPLDYDTDNDGIKDGQEIEDQTDPLDASDNRYNKRTKLIVISFSSIFSFILIYYLSPLVFSRLRGDVETKWVHEGIIKRRQKSDNLLNNKNTND